MSTQAAHIDRHTGTSVQRRDDPSMDFLGSLEERYRIAKAIAKSGMTPHKNPEAVITVMLAGHELGISPMMSCQNMHVIHGKLGMSASLMWGIVAERTGATYQIVKESDEEVELIGTRPEWDHEIQSSFTVQDAKRAGLYPGKKDSAWATYTRDMLFARALARLARRVAPEALAGFYTPDELVSGVAEEAPETAVSGDAPASRTDAVAQAIADAVGDVGVEAADFEIVDDDVDENVVEGPDVEEDDEAAREPAPDPSDLDHWRKKYFATIRETRPEWVKDDGLRRTKQQMLTGKASSTDFDIKDYKIMLQAIEA